MYIFSQSWRNCLEKVLCRFVLLCECYSHKYSSLKFLYIKKLKTSISLNSQKCVRQISAIFIENFKTKMRVPNFSHLHWKFLNKNVAANFCPSSLKIYGLRSSDFAYFLGFYGFRSFYFAYFRSTRDWGYYFCNQSFQEYDTMHN